MVLEYYYINTTILKDINIVLIVINEHNLILIYFTIWGELLKF